MGGCGYFCASIWETPAQPRQPRQLRTDLCSPSPRDFQSRGASGHCLGPREEDSAAEGEALLGERGTAHPGTEGSGVVGEREPRPRRSRGAGTGLQVTSGQEVFPWERNWLWGLACLCSYLGGKKERGGKKPGASFYFILNGSVHTAWLFFCLVKPCDFSLCPTIIYIFLGFFFPRSASDKEMSLV